MLLDIGALAAFDVTPLAEWKSLQDCDVILKETTTANTQSLFNAIFSQPITTTQDGAMASLPAPITVLPRSKPVPAAGPKTRWEKFAQAKGIKKVKKSRKVFDEATGEYKPRYGYQGVNNNLDDWAIEVPQNADPFEDQYEKRREEKKERVAKNKKLERRNAEEREAIVEGKNPREVRKQQLHKAIVQSKVATASMGKFDKAIEGEDSVKVKRQKRKFDAIVQSDGVEKKKVMNIVDQVVKKQAGGGEFVKSKAIAQMARSKRQKTKR